MTAVNLVKSKEFVELPDLACLSKVASLEISQIAQKRIGDDHEETAARKHPRTLAERVARMEEQIQGQQEALLPSNNENHHSYICGLSKLKLSFCTTEDEEKLQFYQDALALFRGVDPLHPSFNRALFMQTGCKVLICAVNIAVEPAEKQKTYEEACHFFSKINNQRDPLFKAAQYWKPSCQYYQAMTEKDVKKKQYLLQEALENFSKVDPHHSSYMSGLLLQGKCKLSLADLTCHPEEKLKLHQEALQCFSKIAPGGLLFARAQELISSILHPA